MEAVFRTILTTDWIIFLYIIGLSLLLLAKKNSGYKLLYFSKLIFTDTYLKTYRDDSLLKLFHVLLIIFSLIVFPLLVQVVLFRLDVLGGLLLVDYLNFLGVFTVFFISKMIIQLIVGVMINKKEKIKCYVFEKQSYFSYLMFIALIPLLLLLFSPVIVSYAVYLFVFLWITIFGLAMLLVVSHFKDVIFKHPLYFILYLCAFEISPLISMYYIIK